MKRQVLEPEQKALEINLDTSIYGAFAEIGAGQEVARFFFKVGAAAGTIAKTMSAYDKVVSDDIYGVEATGRYVCESRLYKMLDHEYDLMINRLRDERPDGKLFAFADTVSAINYSRTIKGSGWMGVRFQLEPDAPPSEVVLHVKMQDKNNTLQQQAVGILGVNLVYACYKHHDNPELFILSLMDQLEERIEVDMIRMDGPDFKGVDHRLLSLYLVKHNLTDVTIFNHEKRNIHASEFLYKRQVLVVRGSFRPITHVNYDMLTRSFEQFKTEPDVEPRKAKLLTELTISNLSQDGEIDEKDFLDRTDLLCELEQTVMITNCDLRYKLIKYLADYRITFFGMVIGARDFLELVNSKYYKNVNGRLLAAFGELFTHNMKLYVYPALQEGSSELMTSANLPIPEGITFLYKHLLERGQIDDINGVESDILHIFSKEVLQMLQSDEEGWDKMVPERIAKTIRENCLFNFPCERIEFEY